LPNTARKFQPFAVGQRQRERERSAFVGKLEIGERLARAPG